MEHLQLFERIQDPVVLAQAKATGLDSKYTADSIVRAYIEKTLQDWQHDTGDISEHVEIVAGIGTLILEKGKTSFIPRDGNSTPMPQPRQAPLDLIHQRLAVCHCCSKWDNKCTLASCNCSGASFVERLYSKCPVGSW